MRHKLKMRENGFEGTTLLVSIPIHTTILSYVNEIVKNVSNCNLIENPIAIYVANLA